MAITNEGTWDDPEYSLTCDKCDSAATQMWFNFDDAVEWKSKGGTGYVQGWRSFKVDSIWEDRCPSCWAI